MNKMLGSAVVVLAVILGAAGANAQEAGFFNIDISSQSKGANVEVRPGDPVTDGVAPRMHILREIVTTGASEVSATVTDEKSTQSSVLDLGEFEAQMALYVRGDDSYEAVVKMSASKKNVSPKSTNISISFDSTETVEFKDENVALLSERFGALVRELYPAQDPAYDAEFQAALKRFAEEYVLGVMDSAPEVINSMLQRDLAIRSKERKPLMETGSGDAGKAVDAEEVKGAIPVGVYEKKYEKKYMSEYYREETLSIRPEEFDNRVILVPEYLTLTSFDIPDPQGSAADALPLAKVEYFIATVPTPYDNYQTTFILSVNYRMQGKITFQKIMEHEGAINEAVFFPRWRLEFLTPALKQVISQGKGAQDVAEREAFVDYFEPFMFDEYYDFSPLLVKARMAFEDKSTQEKIANALKRQAEETQRKIKEMKERQKALAVQPQS